MTLTNYKLFAIRPKAATNLCTNPSFETGTTGWATGGTNTIATSSIQQRRGVYSCKATYQDGVNLLYSMTSFVAGNIQFSADIYIPSGYDGQNIVLYFSALTGMTNHVVGYANMTVVDQWQRVTASVTVDAGDTTGYIRIDSSSTAPTAGKFIYVDGVQIETGTAATTYIDGDQEGNINSGNVLEYYWSGQAHASTSIRTANTRAGGELIDISAYCKNILLEGLGVAPVDNVAVPLTSGGETYLYSNYLSRYFTLRVVFEGSQIGDIQAKRKALLDLIKPDVTGYPQSLVLRYQGYDDAGLLASEPVDIKCQYVSGLDTAPQMRFAHFADITFRLSDVAVGVEGNAGSVLALNDTLANADYIVYQDADGVWHSMAGVPSGSVGVNVIAQHPITKEIYIGGAFTNAGGDANADYLAKWDVATGAWVSVVAGCNAVIYDLAFDAAGNLYIGGAFTDWGGANGDGIVMWNGAALSSLGTGLQGSGTCSTIAINSSGNVYCGGGFSTAGGVANTVNIAKWDGVVWTPLSTGLNSAVTDIAIDKSNNLYIVGTFTNAGDAYGDYVVKWTGAAWVSLGTGSDALLNTAALDDAGHVYVGGRCTTLGGVTVGYWGRWNGQKWEALGRGVNNYVHQIYIKDNLIYLSGVFTTMLGDATILDRISIYTENGIYKPLDIDLPGSPTASALLFDNLDNYYVGYTTAGTATVAGETTVNNPSAVSYPVLEFTGVGALQQVRNYATGKAFFFNSLTLLSGEVITLDLRPDKLTMTSNFRGNVKGYLVKGSNLDFPLIPGDNRIAVFMTGTDASAKGVLKYKTRLHGLDAAQYE